MPTAKPRITITLEPRVYEVLRRLSAAGGESMSTLVTDFLDVAVPPMERMVVVLEQAKALPARTKEQMRSSVLKAEAQLLPTVMALSEQNDLFLADMVKATKAAAADDAKRRPLRPDSEGSTPVPVNTGVRSAERTNKRLPRIVRRGS